MAQKTRDRCYFFHRKYNFESIRVDKSTPYKNEIDSKYDFQTEKWKKQTKKIERMLKSYGPSNKTIAELLGTNERHVAYILKKAMSKVDTLGAKWYCNNHENISGNWKHEQKEGNE